MNIIVIKENNSKTYTVMIDELKAFCIQVEDLKDAPKEFSRLVEMVIKYKISKKDYIYEEFGVDDNFGLAPCGLGGCSVDNTTNKCVACGKPWKNF